jgi:DNA-binding transcriptional ArsR family regulator
VDDIVNRKEAIYSDLTEDGRWHYVSIWLPIMSRIPASADVFRAIADPTRRALLDRLRGGAAPVKALAAEFSQSRPAISKHLRVLRIAQLVREQRVGRERLYEMNPKPLQRVAGWIEGYRAFWIMNLNNLKAHLERRT